MTIFHPFLLQFFPISRAMCERKRSSWTSCSVGLLVLSENRVVDRNPKRRGEVKKSYKNPWSRSPPPSVFFLKSQKNKPEFQSRTLYIST